MAKATIRRRAAGTTARKSPKLATKKATIRRKRKPAAARAKHYSLKALLAKKTLFASDTANLKIDTSKRKGGALVWLSRLTREDGAKWDNMVTVERLATPAERRAGAQTWKTIATYAAT